MEVHQSGGGVVSQASAANAVHSYQDIALLQPHSLCLTRWPYLHTYTQPTVLVIGQPTRNLKRDQKQYDTIRDAILARARKPT